MTDAPLAPARSVRAARGSELTAKSWQTEAPLRMLMNNLDPEVAERPGDLIVYGKATGPDVDLDEQICDPDWLRSAMPSWMEWGNLREMHQPIAAGVGLELQEQGTDWMLRSKCVDESTAKKIEARVLRGYSVGI